MYTNVHSSMITNAPPRRFRCRLAVVLTSLLLLTFTVHAQPQTLQYGTGATGQITAAAPLSFFVIPGLQSEVLTVDVIGLSDNFTPTVSLLSPSQQPVGTTTGSDGSLRLSAVLPVDGNYSLLVGSVNGQAGDFAVRVDGSQTFQAFQIGEGETLQGDIVPNGSPLLLTFQVAESPFVLEIGTPHAAAIDPTALRFSAQVIAANGGQLAQYSGIYGALTLIPPGSGQVFVLISGATADDGGRISIHLSAPGASSASSSSSTSSSSTSTTPDVTSQTSSGACGVIAGPNGVNVRAGDGTDFAPIAQIEPNGQREVIGRNANTSWYAINASGQTGWVAAQVVTLTGNCNGLPVLTAGSAPQQPTAVSGQPTTPAQPLPTATVEGQPTQEGQPPTDIPPAAPTATATTAVQIAPPDSQTFRFDVDRNNGGSFTEVISYPEGDTSDRIEMRVNLGQVGGEATRTVTISLNCNGTGTQYVRFAITSPNGQRYSCGQSITTRYSAPYSTGYYYVFIEEGGPSYVQYTLVATTQP